VPFKAPTVAGILLKQVTQPVPNVLDVRPDCPEELVATVMRCLDKEPENRWPTADALRRALESRASAPYRPRSPLSRRPAARPPSPARPRSPARSRDSDWWEWFEQGGRHEDRQRRRAVREQRHAPKEAKLKQPETEPGIVRKFRSNFASYVSVNGGLLLLNVYTGLGEPWFLVPAVFWGIGLASQYGKLWSSGYSMRDVLNRPAAVDALPSPTAAGGGGGRRQLPEATSGDFGKYAGQLEQLRKDHSAIVRLVERLPASERAMLPDVVPTVDSLFERASELARMLQQMEGTIDGDAITSLDGRIESLEQGTDGPERDRRLDLLKRQRESLAELLGRQGKVEAQLESCVLAVQNMRFDLLRLRSAGVQEVLGDLTSATQAARAMQIDVEAALDAAGEIREALGRGRSKS
jgi:serine/threonine-protein kinase